MNNILFSCSGYKPEEMRQMEFIKNEVIHPEDVLPCKKYIRSFTTVSDDEIKNFDCRIKHRNGYYVHLHVRGKVLKRNKEGLPTQIVNIIQDVTEQRKAEEKIKEQAHFIESIVKATPNIVQLIDMENQELIYINRTVNEFLGYNIEELNS